MLRAPARREDVGLSAAAFAPHSRAHRMAAGTMPRGGRVGSSNPLLGGESSRDFSEPLYSGASLRREPGKLVGFKDVQ